MKTFTDWWIENYIGWGQFRVPATFPYPIAAQSRQEKLNEMNAKLRRV